MSELQSYDEIKLPSERSFALVFGVVFLIIGAWPYLMGGDSLRAWSLAVSLGFFATGLTFPKALYWPNVLWFKFGLALGSVVAPLVMALIFFTVFTPVGIVVRLFGVDLLKQKIDKQAKSYWVSREELPPTSMKNQF